MTPYEQEGQSRRRRRLHPRQGRARTREVTRPQKRQGLLAAAQIPFFINFWISWRSGVKVKSDNPWNATTLEWAAPSPPPHGNFVTEPTVYRGPYEYSVPGKKRDFGLMRLASSFNFHNMSPRP